MCCQHIYVLATHICVANTYMCWQHIYVGNTYMCWKNQIVLWGPRAFKWPPLGSTSSYGVILGCIWQQISSSFFSPTYEV